MVDFAVSIDTREAAMNGEAGTVELGATLGDGLGEPLNWMGELTLLKVTGAETGGRYALAEVYVTPQGFVPLHVHHNEDEAFYVLEGEVTFRVGDQERKGTPGSFIFAPRDVPHTYTVDSSPYARVLFCFSPAGFEGFIRATSEPATSLDPLTPAETEGEMDVAKLMALAAAYGAEILG